MPAAHDAPAHPPDPARGARAHHARAGRRLPRARDRAAGRWRRQRRAPPPRRAGGRGRPVARQRGARAARPGEGRAGRGGRRGRRARGDRRKFPAARPLVTLIREGPAEGTSVLAPVVRGRKSARRRRGPRGDRRRGDGAAEPRRPGLHRAGALRQRRPAGQGKFGAGRWGAGRLDQPDLAHRGRPGRRRDEDRRRRLPAAAPRDPRDHPPGLAVGRREPLRRPAAPAGRPDRDDPRPAA